MLDQAASALLNDDSIPLYVQTILGYLVESKKQNDVILTRNRELVSESSELSKEIASLRAENESLKKALGESQ